MLSEKAKKNKYNCSKNWAKENCDHIHIAVPKGMRERFQKIAKEKGVSLSSLFVELMEMEEAKMKNTWWNDDGIEIVEISGNLYALSGWNGEIYANSWRCIDRYTEAGEPEVAIRPVHRFEEEGKDISSIEENSEEWYRMVEIVDYRII